MSIWYIKECEEYNKFVNKIKRIFNIIEIEQIDGKTICTLPINKNIKNKKIISATKKLNIELYKNNIENVVLSNNIVESNILKNELYKENVNILDGRKLFQFLIFDIVNYIYNNQSRRIEEGQISILVNDNTDINIHTIIDIAKNAKRVNIVTDSMKKFKNVEEYLYNEFGIMIRVSNNQKRDLIGSDIVINVDFPKEILKKYALPNKCVLLNLNEEFSIKTKKFSGINVNYYNVDIPEDYKIEGFNNEIIYESYLYNKPINEIKKQIEIDNVVIKNLVGINGIINKNEFIKLIT